MKRESRRISKPAMRRLHGISRLLLASLLPLSAPCALAAEFTGAAGTGNWSDGGNWSGGTAPTGGTPEDITFLSSASVEAVNDISSFLQVRTLTLDVGFNQSVSGLALFMTGANPQILMNSDNDVAISNDINWLNFGGGFPGLYFDGSGSGNLTLSGTLGSSGTPGQENLRFQNTLNAGGINRFTVTGTNSYTGATQVGAGTIVTVGSDFALGAANETQISDGGTLQLTGGISLQEATLAAAGTGAGGMGAINNASGDNTILGDVQLGAGPVRIQSDAGSLTLAGQVQLSGDTLELAGAGDIRLSGSIAESSSSPGSSIEKTGTGVLTLSGTAHYSGDTGIDEGELRVINGGQLAATGFMRVANAAVTVAGPGSSLANDGDMVLGRQAGTSAVAVEAGGRLATKRSFLGEGSNHALAGAITATADGAGTVWDTGDYLSLGAAAGGTALLTISNGAAMVTSESGMVQIGRGGAGIALVSGAGSQLLVGSSLSAGQYFNAGSGAGAVTIEDGGRIVAPSVRLGVDDSGSSGVLNVLGTPGARGVLETASLARHLGSGAVNFDGGVLRASGSNDAFIDNFDAGDFTIAAGGMFVDSNGFDVGTANVLGGTGALVKQGAGTLALSGANSYTGATTVDAGTLLVNGDQTAATGLTTVNGGATLGGIGIVGGEARIANQGNLAPGVAGIGTLTINGDLQAAGGSVYRVEVDPTSTSSDLVAVQGSATLADGAVLEVKRTPDALYVPGVRYTVMTTQDGLDGAFDLTGETVTAFLRLVDDYDANNAYLVTEQIRRIEPIGETPNQQETGKAVDGRPPLDPVKLPILNLPDDAAARDALDQLSGEIHASIRTAAINDSRYPREAAIDRIRGSFCGVAAQEKQRKDSASRGGAGQSAAECGKAPDRPAVWAQTFGGWGKIDSDGNAADLDQSIAGFFAGVDLAVHDAWRVGVMTGYAESKADVDARNSSARTDNYYLGLYGGGQWGALGLRGGAIRTWQGTRSKRSVAFPGFADKLEADYTGGLTQVFADLGYRLDAGRASFEPFGNLAYVSLDDSDFTESGGPAALTGSSQSTDGFVSTLGVRGSYAFDVSGVSAMARGSLGWRHTSADTPVSTNAFSDGSAFAIRGLPVRDVAVVDVGIDLALGENAAFGLSYGGQFSGKVTDQSVRGVLTVRF